MLTSLKGINKRARLDESHRFGGLYRLLNEESLCWAYHQLNKKAAPGVDKVTHREYGQNLEENIANLVERLKNKAYKAKLVRRTYIPKSGNKMRALGIPVLEDKILQYACAQILENIYEADFITYSYGYRRGLGPHDAIKNVRATAYFKPVNYVVEADIKGFFNNIDHDCLLKMLEERVDDKAFLHLIRKWLKAGILDEKIVLHPETGTPQGGVISPVLANVYLHCALDRWFTNVVKKNNKGFSHIVRYADDFICMFQAEKEATKFYNMLSIRLKEFNLEIAPEKTNLLKFSRFSIGNDNETFEFLGFIFRWELNRKGKPDVKARTSPNKLKKKIAEFKDWIKENRSNKISETMDLFKSKLRGHYNHYGLRGNSKGINRYYYWCVKLLFKWLNRRSQKNSYYWDSFNSMLKYYDVPRPLIPDRHKNKKVKQKGPRQLLLDF